MTEDCFFCNIVKRKVDVFDIFEDDYFFAFLDINPASKGHVLVIPKRHCTVLGQLNDSEKEDLFIVIKKIENAVVQEFGAKGVQVNIPNGASAGQKSSHLIIHIIPVYDKQIIMFKFNKFNKDETNKIATTLKSELSSK